MRRNRRILIAVALVLGATSLYEARRQVMARREANAARAGLMQKIQALENGSKYATETRSLRPPATQPNIGEAEPVSPRTAPTNARPDASRLVSSHPEIRDRFRAAYFAQSDRDHRTLFEQLALSSAQRERFKQRLFEAKLDQLDLHWAGEILGAKKNDPAAGALRQQQEGALRSQLMEIVGPDGYRQFEELRRADGVRDFVNGLATAMILTDRPMNLPQTDRLVATIAAASESYRKGGAAIPWDTRWDEIMIEAAKFLDESQLAALREEGQQRVHLVWKLPEFYAQRAASGNR